MCFDETQKYSKRFVEKEMIEKEKTRKWKYQNIYQEICISKYLTNWKYNILSVYILWILWKRTI